MNQLHNNELPTQHNKPSVSQQAVRGHVVSESRRSEAHHMPLCATECSFWWQPTQLNKHTQLTRLALTNATVLTLTLYDGISQLITFCHRIDFFPCAFARRTALRSCGSHRLHCKYDVLSRGLAPYDRPAILRMVPGAGSVGHAHTHARALLPCFCWAVATVDTM